MRAVLQRVTQASVTVNNEEIGAIKNGFLLLLGIANEDTQEDIIWLTNKIVNLRVFNDSNGIMNNSLVDSNGEILVISQFTLMASTKKGNRPSYLKAAKPELAISTYNLFLSYLQKVLPTKIQTGKFGADMQVRLLNDGPVTIILDTKNKE